LSPRLPPPAASVTATTSWNTTTVIDGAHNFVATAADATGNRASAPLVVLVDNMPPETQIDSGPSGEILVGSATFTFSGSDNLTPVGNLVFSYRLDSGAWSAFASDTTVTFPSLAETSHTFEVKSRDLAGNEDPTPAVRTFTVIFLPSITAVTPSSGPIGTYVTITGTNFEPGATTVSFNGLAAVVRSITMTQITWLLVAASALFRASAGRTRATGEGWSLVPPLLLLGSSCCTRPSSDGPPDGRVVATQSHARALMTVQGAAERPWNHTREH